MTLLADTDQLALVTDNAIPVVTTDGRQLMFAPFRLGLPPSIQRRDANGKIHSFYPALSQFLTQAAHTGPPQLPGLPNITPAIQQQLKKMPPPNALPQLRISSNGGMRNSANGLQSSVSIAHTSPPQPVPVPQHSPNSANGVASRPAISMPHVDVVKTEVHPPSALANGTLVQQTDSTQSTDSASINASPARPKSQAQGVNVSVNGFHVPTNYATAGLSPAVYAQMSNQSTLKTAFANLSHLPQTTDFAALQSQLQRMTYVPVLASTPTNGLQLNTNASLKVNAARQMQWANSLQRPTSVVNGMEGVNTINGVNGVNGVQSSPPPTNHVTATPPTNGTRTAMRISSNGMSPMPQHTPSPIPHIAQSQSPPRLPITPTMAMASPSVQQQQAVGGSQIGY